MTEKNAPEYRKNTGARGLFAVCQAVGFRERSSQIEAIFSAS